MQTFRDIIALWQTAAELSEDSGVSVYIVRSWKERDNIPGHHFNAVVRAAEAGRARAEDTGDTDKAELFSAITLDLLADLAARRRAA